ncbi:MAG: cytochrome c biogenesis protein DipZ [Candidatus Omnitrophota bacterium]
MLILVLFSFMAGVVTLLSPCILPVLPIIMTGAVGRGKLKPWGVVAGFVGSFTFFTLTLSAIVRLTGLPADALRLGAIFLLALFGIFLCIPVLQLRFESFITRFQPRQKSSVNGSGFWSGFVVGMSLGLVWTPCVGPIMAAVITLAAASTISAAAVLITLAYALGTAMPMLAIMLGGRRLLGRLGWIKSHGVGIQRGFGIVMILMAFVLFKGYDRVLQSWVLDRFPAYGSGLAALENGGHVKKALRSFSGDAVAGPVSLSAGVQAPLAPQIIPGGRWFNSLPLSLERLRGKVVVIDFWTYTCINCIRTLPELKAWHERYADKGLVIIGVHTPEFPFEMIPENVARAVRDFGLNYPVVQDNHYATWNAYGNHYWPAKYFIDKDGRIRGAHFGEGGEKESEVLIRRLLEEAGRQPGDYAGIPVYLPQAGSPETYLGLDRTQRFASRENLQTGIAQYTLPPTLELNDYAYQGTWSVAHDHATAALGARLDFHFLAKDVFLVMRPLGKGAGRVAVFIDGKLVGMTQQGRDVLDGFVLVQDDRLYHLLSLKNAGEHTLMLRFLTNDVALFAFTFG